jgi:hypothetical protein
MGMFLAQEPVGGGPLGIVVHRNPRLLQRQRHIRLGHGRIEIVLGSDLLAFDNQLREI